MKLVDSCDTMFISKLLSTFFGGGHIDKKNE